MKAWKIVIALVILLVLAVGGAVLWVAGNADRLVGDAVTDAGHELAGSRVTVDAVDVNLVRGKATLTGLRIANPSGYSQRPALLLGSIDVNIDLGTIGNNMLVIDQVVVTDPEVSFELNEAGVSNISVLEDNIESATPSGTSGDEERFIINQASFRGGTITAISAQRPGKELVFDFPTVSFTGLGAPNGATAEQIGEEVSTVLLARIMDAAQRAGVESLLEKQKERALEEVQDLLREKVDELRGEGDDG